MDAPACPDSVTSNNHPTTVMRKADKRNCNILSSLNSDLFLPKLCLMSQRVL